MIIYLYLSGQSQCLFFFQIIYFTSEYFKYNENKKYNSFVFKTLFEVSTIKRWGFCTKKKKTQWSGLLNIYNVYTSNIN